MLPHRTLALLRMCNFSSTQSLIGSNIRLLTSYRRDLLPKWKSMTSSHEFGLSDKSEYGNWVHFTPCRHRMWSAQYRNNTIDKEELYKELPEDDERRYHPIIAAPSSQNTAVRYDPIIEKFINTLMEKGNKALAREILDKTLLNLKRMQLEKYHRQQSAEEKQQVELDARVIVHRAVENCKPLLWLRDIRKGGVMYEVPAALHGNMQQFRSFKFLINAAKDKDRTVRFHVALARELLAASKNEGKAIRHKQELHRKCEANRAYAHFRW